MVSVFAWPQEQFKATATVDVTAILTLFYDFLKLFLSSAILGVLIGLSTSILLKRLNFRKTAPVRPHSFCHILDFVSLTGRHI